ncbi:MAG: fibronectin type III domain-containing protein, partial [Elusimicrobiota bacterium]
MRSLRPFILLAALFAMAVPRLHAASATNSPTSASGTNWTTPENITDGSYDTWAITPLSSQDYLKATGFAFSIPDGSTIEGIQVTVEANGTAAQATKRLHRLGLTKDGSLLAGTELLALALNKNTDTPVLHGGAADLWGTTWSPSDINSSNFGILIRDDDTSYDTLRFDDVIVTVYFAPPPIAFPFDSDFEGVLSSSWSVDMTPTPPAECNTAIVNGAVSWHINDSSAVASTQNLEFSDGAASPVFGNGANRVSGNVTSFNIDVSASTEPYLSFWYRFGSADTYTPSPGCTFPEALRCPGDTVDHFGASVSTAAHGCNTRFLSKAGGVVNTYTFASYPLSALRAEGDAITIRFGFDSYDGSSNTGFGATVDNVYVLEESTPPSHITSFFASSTTAGGELRLSWGSPGDDGMSGSITAPGGGWRIQLTTDTAFSSWSRSSAPPEHVHTLDISTDSIAAGTFVSMTVAANFNDYHTSSPIALLGAATYYGRIWAGDNIPNWSTTTSNAASGQTLPFTPSTDTLTGVTSGSLTLSFSNAGNSTTAQYLVEVSLESGFSSVSSSTWFQSTGTVPSFSTGSLSANTTYYLRVIARNTNLMQSAYSAVVTTITLPVEPGTADPAFTSVEASSITFQWTANGNGPGTDYVAEISTDDFSSVNVSSATKNLWALFGWGGEGDPLDPNITHYFRVKSVGSAGAASAYAATASTITLPALPASADTTGVYASSVTFAWAGGGNQDGTDYVAQISTDVFASVNFSSATKNLSVFFGDDAAGGPLQPNTTYDFRVKATGPGGESAFTGVVSAITVSAAPQDPALTDVEVSSITFTWSAGNNPPGTDFFADISTDDFSTVEFTSTTKNLSVLFGGAFGAWQPLVPNTSYYFRVKADSPYTGTVSTITLPALPLSATLSAVELSSITFSWAANGNPDGTDYRADISTDDFATVNLSSVTKNLSEIFGEYGAGDPLDSNTTHYFRVKAVGCGGAESVFTAAVSAITLPALPQSTALSAIGVSSITLSWSAENNHAQTDYVADISRNSDFSSVEFSSGTKELSALFGTGGAGGDLTANSTYYLRVKASGWAGEESAFTATLATSTLAAVPVSPALSAVEVSAITFGWAANGNPPAGTDYVAEVSTDSFATTNISYRTTNVSEIFGAGGAGEALRSDTRHYFRVKAVNHNGHSTAFAATQDDVTLPADPGAGDPDFGSIESSSITFRWTANNNAPDTDYRAQVSTDAFATVNLSSVTKNVSVLFGEGEGGGGDLTPDTTYYFQVRTEGRLGSNTDFSPSPSTATLTLPAVPGISPSTFTAVELSSITFQWTANGNPSYVDYEAEISTDGFATANVALSTKDLSVSFGEGGQGEALGSNATHYFRVRAVGRSGIASPYSTVESTVTLPAEPGTADPVFSDVQVSSVTFQWAASSNAAQTDYRAEISTDGFATVNVSSLTKAVSLLFGEGEGGGGALTPNTTHYFRVRTAGHGGLLTDFTATESTSTLAEAPASLSWSDLGEAQVRVNWSANGNPSSITRYEAELSTASDFDPVYQSSATWAVDALFTGLYPGTSHYSRVRAVNHGGVPSAYATQSSTKTLPRTDFVAPSSATAVTALTGFVKGSVKLSWTAPGDDGDSGDIGYGAYRIRYTNSPSATWDTAEGEVEWTTSTCAGCADGYLVRNLGPGTTYYFWIKVRDELPDNWSELSDKTTAWAGLYLDVIVHEDADTFAKEATAFSNSRDVVRGSDGRLWISYHVYSTKYEIWIASSSDNGETWRKHQLVAGANDHKFPTLAVDGDDNLHLVWTETSTPDKVWYKKYEAASGAWQSPTLLYNGDAETPSEDVDFVDNVYVCWDDSGRYVQYREFNLDEGVWSATVTVFDAGANDRIRFPAIDVDKNLRIHLFWTGKDASNNYHLYYSQYDGSFLPFETISTSTWLQELPALVLDSSETHHVIFYEQTGATAYQISYTSGSHGNWATPSAIASVSGANLKVSIPDLTIDADDVMYAFWQYADTGSNRYEIRRSSKHVDDASWAPYQVIWATDGAGNETQYATSRWANFHLNSGNLDLAWMDGASVRYTHDTNVNLSLGKVADTVPPAAAGDLTAESGPGDLEVTLTWSTAGDDGYSGNLGSFLLPGKYRIMYSTHSDASDKGGWDRDNYDIEITTYNISPLSLQTRLVTGFSEEEMVHFRLWTRDEATEGWSGISNSANAYARVRPDAATDLAATQVFASSAAFTWTATGDDGSTGDITGGEFRIQYTTDPADAEDAAFWDEDDAQVQVGTDTTQGSAQGYTATGLLGGATLYFRLWQGDDILSWSDLSNGATVQTKPAEPAYASFTVETTSITAVWTANNHGSVQYDVEVSTASDFDPVLHSSTTQKLSVLFGTGGEGGALDPNTTHYFRVKARNTSEEETAYIDLGSTATLAALPLAGDPVFSSVELSSVTVDWTAEGNPGDTEYTAEISTNGFASLNLSSVTLNVYALFGTDGEGEALESDRTYSFRVRAVNKNGLYTDYTTLGSTLTLLAAPTGQALSNVTTLSATFTWSANGNRAGTHYVAEMSLASDFSSIEFSSDTIRPSVLFGSGGAGASLDSNTTYYFRVKSVGFDASESAFTTVESTITLPALPGTAAPVFTDVEVSSVAFYWTANGNRAQSDYTAQVSTDNFFTLNLSSTTKNISVLFGRGEGGGGPLDSNTTHYFRVKTLGFGGQESAFTAKFSTISLPAVPGTADPAFTGIEVDSVTFTWTANGNRIRTDYKAEISLASDFSSVEFSSTTKNLSVLFGTDGAGSPLDANTTHYFRVKALGWAGLESAPSASTATLTLPAVPGTADPVFTDVGVSSVTFYWTANSNRSQTDYAVEISTDAFATLNLSSTTKNLSALFGLGEGGGGPLDSNTTHYFRVKAMGFADKESAFATVRSTITRPALPGTADPLFTGVEVASITFQWTANGNRVQTDYAVEISTDGFATLNLSSTTKNLSALFGLDEGGGGPLDSNTTHYFRVKALGFADEESAFTATVDTITLPAAPGAASPVFTDVEVSSVTFYWTANNNRAQTDYLAQISTDSFATVNVASTTKKLSVLFGLGEGGGEALDVNTTYYFRAKALGWADPESEFAAVQSTATLSLAPGGASPVFTTVGDSSATFSWADGGNPAATLYEAQVSTDGFVSLNVSSRTADLSKLFGAGGAGESLNANTLHYFRVRAVNFNNVPSTFAAVSSTLTLPATPGEASPAFSAIAVSSITFAWTANSNQAQTDYTAQISTDDFATVNVSSATKDLSVLFGEGGGGGPALDVNTTYYFRVKATGSTGIGSAFSTSRGTSTLTLAPGAGSPPFSLVGVSSATFQWTDVSNPAGTEYEAQVSTDNVFATVNLSSRTKNLSVLFGLDGTGVKLRSNTTHYFRVRALNRNSVPSGFATTQSTATLVGQSVEFPYEEDFEGNLDFWDVVKSFASPPCGNTCPAGNSYWDLRSSSAMAPSSMNLDFSDGQPSPSFANAANRVCGGITSINIDVSASTEPYLTFWYRYGSADTYNPGAGCAFPEMLRCPNDRVDNFGASVSSTTHSCGTRFLAVDANKPEALSPNDYYFAAYPLNAIRAESSTITVRFGFDSYDGSANTGFGMDIDDLHVVEESTPPAKVTTLAASSTTSAGEIVLSWESTGDDGSSGDITAPGGGWRIQLTTDSAFADWDTATTPPSHVHTIHISTDGISPGTLISTSVASNMADFYTTGAIALLGGSSYYARVWAGDNIPNWGEDLSNAATAQTLCFTPSTDSLSGITTGSITLNFSDSGNGTPAGYLVEYSTRSDFVPVSSSAWFQNAEQSTGTIIAGGVGGLDANTTYYLRALARNSNLLTTAYSALAATATLAGAPATAATTFTVVGLTSVTVAWDRNGNAVDVTTYTAVLSTGPSYPNGFSGNVPLSTAPAGASPTATLSGLEFNTTYYLFVEAVNHNGLGSGYTALGSTATLTYPPATAVTTFTLVDITSMTVAWERNGNLVDVTTYTAVLSTGASYPNAFVGNLSLSTAPAGASPTATLTSLEPNTTYYLFAESRNHNGRGSGFIALGSTATLAYPPATAVTTFTVVNITSMTVAWDRNGNPVDVSSYTAVLSTGSSYPNSFSGNQTLSTAPAGASPTATLTSLEPNTTYYLYVKATNHNGLGSGFTALGSTATLTFPPASQDPTGTTASAFQANWTANATPPTLPYTKPRYRA